MSEPERGAGRLTAIAVGIGTVIGLVWALSPLTVLFAIGLVPLGLWAARGLPAAERRRLFVWLSVAVAARLVVIAGLFLTADPNAGSFATLVGDEQFLELRALWLRNLLLHVPISRESFIYSASGTGWTSYIPISAYVQTLFGPAPYGVRLFNLLLFLLSTFAMFRTVRRSFGPFAAFAGLAVILWMPSLFVWSVSGLKEPLYLMLVTAAILFAVHGCRASTRWPVRAGMLVLVMLSIYAIETVRPGGQTLMLGGLIAGAAFRILAWNRRVAAVSVVVAPIVLALLLFSVTPIKQRVMAQVEWGARWHRGHVLTKGHAYTSLDPRFYLIASLDSDIATMTGAEAGRYVVRQVWAFLTVPLPWQAVSRAELLILPEQLLIYCALLLLPAGIGYAAGRDPMLTSMLAGYSVVSALVIALTSGNVGTVVRHRALVFPYVVWFSVLGAARLLFWLSRPRVQTDATHHFQWRTLAHDDHR
jgi:hypothetical protein